MPATLGQFPMIILALKMLHQVLSQSISQAALLIASLKAGRLSGVYLSIMSERKTRLTISAIRHMMRFAYHWKFGVSLSNALCLDWGSLQENVEKDRMPWSVSQGLLTFPLPTPNINIWTVPSLSNVSESNSLFNCSLSLAFVILALSGPSSP